MTEDVKPSDIPVDGKPRVVKDFNNATGYPFELDEDRVVRLIYFFGSRKCSVKAMKKSGGLQGNATKVANFSSSERKVTDEAFGWFGFAYSSPTEQSAAYRALTLRFKAVLAFLRQRPAFITTDIRTALKTAGYESVLRNVVMVMNENREYVPRLVDDGQKKNIIPLGKMEMQMWDFQNLLSDKMKLIIESITLTDIKHANLGIKSKALRDLYSVMHMARMGTKNPNLSLINVNINADGVKSKMQAISNYVQKNRESG
jgi:hypothetical protein